MFDFSASYYQHKIDAKPQIAVPAESFRIVNDIPTFKNELKALINQAQCRIYITALYLQDDESGREILDCIYRRSEENPQLEVFILVDFHRAQRGLMGKGKQCGNHVMYREYALNHPRANVKILGIPVKSKEVFGVLHLKGFVIDDYVLYSGASINNVYLAWDTRYRLDRYQIISNQELADSLVQYIKDFFLTSPAVTDLCQDKIPAVKYIYDKISFLKKNLKHSCYKFNPSHSLSKSEVGIVPLVGLGNIKNQLNHTIIELIDACEKKITICTPYFNMPRPVSKNIARLLKRGCHVTIVVGDKIANDFYIPEDQKFNRVGAVPYMYQGILRDFCQKFQNYIDNGQLDIMLWKDGTNTYHVKGMFVDDNYYLLTGNNINPRAWRMDIENGLLVKDPHKLLRESFAGELNNILTNTKRISNWQEIEDFSQYPERIQNYLRKIYRFKLHLLIKRII